MLKFVNLGSPSSSASIVSLASAAPRAAVSAAGTFIAILRIQQHKTFHRLLGNYYIKDKYKVHVFCVFANGQNLNNCMRFVYVVVYFVAWQR